MTIETCTNGIRVMTVAGSPEHMGLELGRELGHEINLLFRARYAIVRRACGLAEDAIETACRRLWRAIETNTPAVALEAGAAATASGLASWQMVIAGGYTDALDVLGAVGIDQAECTIGVRRNGPTIFGTWDSHPEAREGMLVLRRLPDVGISTLALTTAGWPCQFGINAMGVGFGITNLTPSRSAPDGIIYIAALADAVAETTARSAAARLGRLPLASGHFYLFVDDTDAELVETTSSGVRRRPSTETLVETNHYTTGIDDNGRYCYLEGSQRRAWEMEAALPTFDSPQAFAEWLPNSHYVWRHEPSGTAVTCAAFAVAVGSRGLWVSPGDRPQEMAFVPLVPD